MTIIIHVSVQAKLFMFTGNLLQCLVNSVVQYYSISLVFLLSIKICSISYLHVQTGLFFKRYIGVKSAARAAERGGGQEGQLAPGPLLERGPPKMFELYIFDVTKIKDSDQTNSSWVIAIVTALKMQGNSVSECWSPKGGWGPQGQGLITYMTSSGAPNQYFVPGPTKPLGGPVCS